MEEKDLFKYFNKPNIKQQQYLDMWITLNRECNMRCKWCYAASTGYAKEDKLSVKDVKDLVKLAKSLGVKNITLIGGEPTMFNELFQVISFIKQNGLKVILVTNGLRLADAIFVNQLSKAGLDSLSISIKGYDERTYKSNTGGYGFSNIERAIGNLCDLNIELLITIVITYENINYLPEMIEKCQKYGAKRFSFTFSYDFSGINRKSKYDINREIFDMVNKFQGVYYDINRMTDGNFRLKQSFPLCAWNMEFIKMMEKRGQINYVCQLLKNSGIVFNERKELIPCNAMHGSGLGVFGVDFWDSESFLNFVESREIKKIFQRFRNLPDKKCYSCPWMIKCRGGCISNWYNFSMLEFLQCKQERENNVT